MSDSDLQCFDVETKASGTIKVFVQGSLADKQGKTIFLTVHDMGSNHRSLVNFVNHPAMADVKARSVFLHVCVPGQEDHAPDFKGDYPTLTQLGDDLVCVLDHPEINVKFCVGIGEGAGANIICRFAMDYPNRLLGVCLVHCTSTTAGVLEYIKDKVLNWKLKDGEMTQAAWEYLVFHKFGPGQDEKNDNVKKYMEDLQQRMNAGNLSRYLEVFMKRTDISTTLAQKLKMEALLVVGSKASHIHTVYTMHQAMPREKATLLVVDGVGDVMTEAPDRLTRALVLFAKGCGVLSGVAIPGMERQRTLSSSMEEADRPRKMSLTSTPQLPK